jgi:hypothetical protein
MQAENSDHFKEYSTFEEFERFFTIKVGKLSAEIDQFDEDRASRNDLRIFLKTCAQKLEELKEIMVM